MIFNDAANLNMTGAGYVWVVTEQALDASNVPDGLLGLKLINATQEKSHITDSLSVLILSIIQVGSHRVVSTLKSILFVLSSFKYHLIINDQR